VKKVNQALPDLPAPLAPKARKVPLVHLVHRARKVHLVLQVRPRTPFELYALTARLQRAEESAIRTKY
jgi:hypothetical protein